MNRRSFLTQSALSLAAAGIGLAASGPLLAANGQPAPIPAPRRSGSKPTVAFVVYPGLTPLDIIGPANALNTDAFNLEFIWRDRNPVEGEQANVRFMPTTTFREMKHADVICITGTSNPYALLHETEMLDWLNSAGHKADWVTSVCTGSVLLGAAGLLQGYRATTHWGMMDDLALFGAIPVDDRVVIDRNRMSGGGVTAGIDFGLTLRSILLGQESAEMKQLMMQYAPEPPFNSGTPQQARPEVAAAAKQQVLSGVTAQTPDWRQRLADSAERMQHYPER